MQVYRKIISGNIIKNAARSRRVLPAAYRLELEITLD
jgi:hypothetical protein